jgi:hypothetical protein
VAEFLDGYPEGLELGEAIVACNRSHPWLARLTGVTPEPAGAADRLDYFLDWQSDERGRRLRVVETGGDPGDVLLCHPFLYHAASQNHRRVPRFMCNRTTPLRERMSLRSEPAGGWSPLEESVRGALRVAGRL